MLPLLYPDTATDYFTIDNEDIQALRKGVTEASLLTTTTTGNSSSLAPTTTTSGSTASSSSSSSGSPSGSPRSPNNRNTRVSSLLSSDSPSSPVRSTSSSTFPSPSRALQQISGSKSLTYGEIRPVSIEQHIIPALNLQDNDVIYDLGCGTGKISLQIALWCVTHNIRNIQSKGIELAKNRIQAGEKAVQIMHSLLPSSSTVSSSSILPRNEVITPLMIEDQLRSYHQLLQEQTSTALFTQATSASSSSSSGSSPRRRSRQQLYSSCYNRNGTPTTISSSSLVNNKLVHASVNELPFISKSVAATLAQAASLCSLYQGDMLTDDYSDATVIFINNTVFDQTLMIPLIAKLATLPKLRTLVVLRKLCGRHTQCEKLNRPCSVFQDPPIEGICNPTWCDHTTIFTYTRLPYGTNTSNDTKLTMESPVKRIKNHHNVTKNSNTTMDNNHVLPSMGSSNDSLWRHSPIESTLYTDNTTISSPGSNLYEPPKLPNRKQHQQHQQYTISSSSSSDRIHRNDHKDDHRTSKINSNIIINENRTATNRLARAIEANNVINFSGNATPTVNEEMDNPYSLLETPIKPPPGSLRRGSKISNTQSTISTSSFLSPGVSSVTSSDDSPIIVSKNSMNKESSSSSTNKNNSSSSSIILRTTIGQKFDARMRLEETKNKNSNNKYNNSGCTVKHPDPLPTLRD